MGVFLPPGGGLAANIGLNGRIPSIPSRINVKYFFDRPRVKDAMDRAKYWSLYKAGSVVMQTARRSIKKKGLARPKLQIMKDNPGVALSQLARMPGIRPSTRRQLRQRIWEIKNKPPSPPGTPPHTHTGVFRRDIVYAYDPVAESVVVGQFMQGGAWLAALHEYGGTQRMQAYAFIPKYEGRYTGIIGWWRVGKKPRLPGRWHPLNMFENHSYPARPYMRPSITNAAAKSEVVAKFAGQFRAGGGG
mgnify:CR=1 FL=1